MRSPVEQISAVPDVHFLFCLCNVFSKDDWAMQLQVKVSDGEVIGIRCMEAGCKYLINEAFIRKVVRCC